MDKKFYLTKRGLEKLKEEYKRLKELRMARTKGREIPKILHSEEPNPEYLLYQEDISFLESRIADLEYILKNAEIIKIPPKSKRNVVNLGATVTLEEGGKINEFTIVGTLEANPGEGKISSESPVGKALLGKKVGDEVIITSPIKIIYKIKKIRYPPL